MPTVTGLPKVFEIGDSADCQIDGRAAHATWRDERHLVVDGLSYPICGWDVRGHFTVANAVGVDDDARISRRRINADNERSDRG
jgi:hypothetical protein